VSVVSVSEVKYSPEVTTMKFNKKVGLENRPGVVRNAEGDIAFQLDARTRLAVMGAARLVGEKQFYRSGEQADAELAAAIADVVKVDPEFVLQTAVWLRKEMNLRDTPLFICGEYANNPDAFIMTDEGAWINRVSGASDYVAACIGRPDGISNLLAYQFNLNAARKKRGLPVHTRVPSMIKKGIAKAFPKFDAYSIKKNDAAGRQVRLRDALRMCRPTAADEQQRVMFNQLYHDELPTPMTWEVMRSTGKMNWHQVINEVFYHKGKVNNYMAILRNLANCLGAPDVTNDDIILLSRMISDPEAVARGKQFPFRYLSAYREVVDIKHPMRNTILDGIQAAYALSVENIPRLPGITLIASDTSVSMNTPISAKSKIEYIDIGLTLSVLANKICDNSITGVFGTDFVPVAVPKISGLEVASLGIEWSRLTGWATYGHKVIDYLRDRNLAVDRIMMFTDTVLYSTTCRGDVARAWDAYRAIAPNATLYIFDLAGTGNIFVPPGKNVVAIGGWSDKVLNFCTAFENQSALVDHIKSAYGKYGKN